MKYVYYGQELYHHGILGMKWGVRRYQNKDGTLTAEGKRHVSTYNKKQELKKRITDEASKLIDSNEQLKRDFGSGDNVDDEEFLEIVAKDYGLDTKGLSEANTDYYSFCKNNRDSIKAGEQITKKLLK